MRERDIARGAVVVSTAPSGWGAVVISSVSAGWGAVVVTTASAGWGAVVVTTASAGWEAVVVSTASAGWEATELEISVDHAQVASLYLHDAVVFQQGEHAALSRPGVPHTLVCGEMPVPFSFLLARRTSFLCRLETKRTITCRR